MRKKKGLVGFSEAVSLLKAGKVVALPTETVYGLAASIYSLKALKKIFHLKNRPFTDPLIVHCKNSHQAESLVIGDIFLAKALWAYFSPGPLTVVLSKTKRISPLITAQSETVAIRIPSHPLLLRILKKLDEPLAAPSANLFGQTSPTRASHVLSAFSGSVPVLDGGSSAIGLESTIVWPDIFNREIIILRPGAVSAEDLKKFLKQKKLLWKVRQPKATISKNTSPPTQRPAFTSARLRPQKLKVSSCEHSVGELLSLRSRMEFPGSLSKHYAPCAPLLFIKSNKSLKEIKSFLVKKYPGKRIQNVRLSSSSQVTASSLYHQLHTLPKRADILFVCKKKNSKYTKGLWPGIWDRLKKASSQTLSVS